MRGGWHVPSMDRRGKLVIDRTDQRRRGRCPGPRQPPLGFGDDRPRRRPGHDRHLGRGPRGRRGPRTDGRPGEPRRSGARLPLGVGDEARHRAGGADRRRNGDFSTSTSRPGRPGRPSGTCSPTPRGCRSRARRRSRRPGRGGSTRTRVRRARGARRGADGSRVRGGAPRARPRPARDGRDRAPRTAVGRVSMGRSADLVALRRRTASADAGHARDARGGHERRLSRAWSASCRGSVGSTRAIGASGFELHDGKTPHWMGAQPTARRRSAISVAPGRSCGSILSPDSAARRPDRSRVRPMGARRPGRTFSDSVLAAAAR